jgi:hypothetical protein
MAVCIAVLLLFAAFVLESVMVFFTSSENSIPLMDVM